MPAKNRWSELQGRRSAVLQRARDAAKLTIPALLPEEGANDSTELPTPFQSLGAEGVNNLSSKLLLALFPPNTAFFRLKIDEDVVADLGKRKVDVEERLSKIERKGVLRVEKSMLRPVANEVLAHLIVAGNSLMFVPENDEPRMYRIDQFCVVRDGSGNVMEVVVKECVHSSTLPAETLAACGVKASEHKNVDVYTHIKWTAQRVTYHEEINDVVVPESKGSHPKDKTPWLVLRWKAVPNNDYGRGLIEEYIGDLTSLEGIAEAVVSFAAVAAKIILMVKPGSSTSAEDINEAETGDAVSGNAEDVSYLQLEKQSDFQVVKSVAEGIEQRLSRVFMLTSGLVRDAERVTAEEIRMLAQQLEDVLGGVYTVLAAEFQLPLVRRLLAVMTKLGEIPPLPKGIVEPIIVTGFEALGRNHTTNKLRAFLADAKATLGDGILEYINVEVALKQLGTGHGVEGLDELIKTPDEVAAARQQGLMATMGQQAAGPVAGQLAKGLVESQQSQ